MKLTTYINAGLTKVPILDMFSLKKTVSIRFLNRLGAQPFRIWLAEKRYALRGKKVGKELKYYIETLEKDGIVVIENFLPQEQFEALEAECLLALDKEERTRIKHDGPNVYTNINFPKLKAYKQIRNVLGSATVQQLFNAAERRSFGQEYIAKHLTTLVQGPEGELTDPETELHEDTFFNTFKAWLYITDVELEDAPFVFVKGSHKNDVTRRKSKSFDYSLKKDKINSRRISEDELRELGLEETHYVAKKNTLVMANTLGFHRRLRGKEGHIRIGLAYSTRFNPFI